MSLSAKDQAYIDEVRRILESGESLVEPKWRITIEGSGPIGDTLWATINVSKQHWGDDTWVVHYEEFPLYAVAVDGEVVRQFPSPNGDRSGREETSHRTARCATHGYYCWRETERASEDPACPQCHKLPYEEKPLHERERLDGVSGA